MKKRCTILGILTLLLLSVPVYTQARTGYVSDMLFLTFRQGPGASFSVIQTLKSNTPLTILEEENEYYKVEIPSGDIGWVDQQFVVFETPKIQIIEQLHQEKAALKTQLETLSKDLEQLKTQLAAQESDQGEKTTALGAGFKDVVNKNKTLEQENILLANKLAQFEKETGHMFRSAMIKWFLAGVGVLLLGWIIGQSVSSKKQRNSSLLG